MNDPVALLLVTGFIAWIEEPGLRPAATWRASWSAKLVLGAAFGVAIGLAARAAFRRLDYPTAGLYPVASIATAALAYGVTEVAHGSGFLAVYLTALFLGTGPVPGRRTIVAFHQGLGWVAQISLFFLLGLLVFPSELLDVAERRPADLGRADLRRPPAGGVGRQPPGPLLAAGAGDAGLGRAARRDPDLARDLPGDRGRRAQRPRSSTSSSSSSSPRPWSRARPSSRWRGGWG